MQMAGQGGLFVQCNKTIEQNSTLAMFPELPLVASNVTQNRSSPRSMESRAVPTNQLSQKAALVNIVPHGPHLRASDEGSDHTLQIKSPALSVVQASNKTTRSSTPKPDAEKKPAPAPSPTPCGQCRKGEYCSEGPPVECKKGCGEGAKNEKPNADDNCECKEGHQCYDKRVEEEINSLIKEMKPEAQTKIKDIVKSETADPQPGCPMREEGSSKSQDNTATSKVQFKVSCLHCKCLKASAPRIWAISTLLFVAAAFFGTGLL